MGTVDCSESSASRAADEHAPSMVWQAKTDGLLDYFNSHADFRIRSRTGRYRWFAGQAAMLRETANSPRRWLGACVDLEDKGTRHEVLGAELHAQLWSEELERAAQRAILREVHGKLCHDLSQPLTAIQSNAQALEAILQARDNLDPEVQAILTDIVAEIRRAVESLRDERGPHAMALPRATCQDVRQLVLSTVGLHVPKMLIQDCSLTIDLPRALPQVFVEQEQAQLAIGHVLANAIESACDMPREQRHIHIRGERQTRDFVRITITDNGRGFETIAQAFVPFYSTKPQHLGLGLGISRSIVEAHGGRIGIATRREGGAAVHMDLPCASMPGRRKQSPDALK